MVVGIIVGIILGVTETIVGLALLEGRTLGIDGKVGLSVRFRKSEPDNVGCGEEINVGLEISDAFINFVGEIEGIRDTERAGALLIPDGTDESSGGDARKVGRKEGEGNCGEIKLGTEEGKPDGCFCGLFENSGDGNEDGCEKGTSDGRLTVCQDGLEVGQKTGFFEYSGEGTEVGWVVGQEDG